MPPATPARSATWRRDSCCLKGRPNPNRAPNRHQDQWTTFAATTSCSEAPPGAPPPIALALQGGLGGIARAQPMPLQHSRHAWWRFVDHPFWVCFRLPAPCRADHSRVKQGTHRALKKGREAAAQQADAPPGARASRPHNSGKALRNSSTRLDRQRLQGSALAGPMPFPPAGWPGAASQGN